VALLVVCVLDLVVAWALQVYFRPVDDDLARLAG
jgi:hypothetical protein